MFSNTAPASFRMTPHDLILIVVLALGSIGPRPGFGQIVRRDNRDEARLDVVRAYADRVLEQGTDRWSGRQTPLLADGVHVDTGEPVVWKYKGETYIISNLASQQNLFRVLTGLSHLTGDPKYKNAAKDSIRYHFDHLADKSGLLRWGGHQFIDLATLQPVGKFDSNCHEFKHSYPFYELMWEVDSQATARFIRAMWNTHVNDWRVLDMNRHGRYGKSMGKLWDNSFDDPKPFFEADGLSFINAGSDLIYAAGLLYRLGGEEKAWIWGRRLAGMYVKARHPETGLGASQYSKPRRRAEPPEEGPLRGRDTYSNLGDRAENQFGRQFGPVAREGWAVWSGSARTVYVGNAFMQLELAEAMGEEGRELLEWTADGLEALARHAYLPESNAFRPLWADGTDLTGKKYGRTGYYGKEGTTWKPLAANMEFLMVYARAHHLSRREILWNTARQIARGLGIGDIGDAPGENVSLKLDAPGDGYKEIFTLLALYRAAPHAQYLQRARIVADRMIERHYIHGFFLPSAKHVHADFNRLEPLAILALDAVLRGKPELVPAHVGSRGFIHGRFDGHGRTYDSRAIWSVTREGD